MLSKEDIGEFKKIYKEEFDEDLSGEKALELATAALNIMQAIYQPLLPEAQKQCLVKLFARILVARAWNLRNRMEP